MIKVSVIIPVYNTEDYLNECLDSIINQTLEDIEIICINDGSTDNSLAILNEYKSKDSRIKIKTQENKGLSFSRNVGLDMAKGKYIYFMDSDDILELEALEKLYGTAEKNELDMIIFKLINLNDEDKSLYTTDYYEMDFLKEILDGNIFSYDDVRTKVVDIAVTQQSKFYNRNLISDMEFPNGLIFEDHPFFIESFFKAKRVFFYEEHLCKRRIRNQSITTSKNLRFTDTLAISTMIVDLAKKYNHYDELREVILNKKIKSAFHRFNTVEETYKKEFFERIRNDFILIKDDVENSTIDHKNRYVFDNALKSKNYKEFELKVNYYLQGYFKEINAYEFIRIDMKNKGNEDNSLEIIENSDKYLQFANAPWSTDDTGEGFLIESHKGELDLKLKIINDGELSLWFKGADIKDENNNRIKILVDYTSLIINGKNYLSGHNLYGYDKAFSFKKDVNDSEIIDIHIEWMTYDKMNSYVDEIKKYEELPSENKESKSEKFNLSAKSIKNIIKRN